MTDPLFELLKNHQSLGLTPSQVSDVMRFCLVESRNQFKSARNQVIAILREMSDEYLEKGQKMRSNTILAAIYKIERIRQR